MSTYGMAQIYWKLWNILVALEPPLGSSRGLIGLITHGGLGVSRHLSLCYDHHQPSLTMTDYSVHAIFFVGFSSWLFCSDWTTESHLGLSSIFTCSSCWSGWSWTKAGSEWPCECLTAWHSTWTRTNCAYGYFCLHAVAWQAEFGSTHIRVRETDVVRIGGGG